MTVEEFEQTLRTYLRRRPFLPFTVILNDGERIEVDVPNAIAFGGGAAAYIGPTRGDGNFFECEEVSHIEAVTHGAAS